MTHLFISYRRGDAADEAENLYYALVEDFGEEAVFFDRETLPLGLDWRDAISRELDGCAAMIAVIGPNWLGETRDGNRLSDPDDWVRFEIDQAITRKIRVIPVLVNQATGLPDATKLPEPLGSLVHNQFLDLNDWEQEDLDRLLEDLSDCIRETWTADLDPKLPSGFLRIRVRLSNQEHNLEVFTDSGFFGRKIRMDIDNASSYKTVKSSPVESNDFLLTDGRLQRVTRLWFDRGQGLTAIRLMVDGRLLVSEGAWEEWVPPAIR